MKAKRTKWTELSTFQEAYFTAAFFTNLPEGTAPPGEFKDTGLAEEYFLKIPQAEIQKGIRDCDAFEAIAGELIDECGAEQAGADFWFTRNGHGCGFWDGDWEENGDRLTDLSKSFGQVDLYRGDSGRWYFMP